MFKSYRMFSRKKYERHQKYISRLEKLLKEAWFDEDWEIYTRGPYLQLYKTNWFNHNQGGIHFETSIEAPQLKEKASICMLKRTAHRKQFGLFLRLEANE